MIKLRRKQSNHNWENFRKNLDQVKNHYSRLRDEIKADYLLNKKQKRNLYKLLSEKRNEEMTDLRETYEKTKSEINSTKHKFTIFNNENLPFMILLL